MGNYRYRQIRHNPDFRPPPLSNIRARALDGQTDKPGVRFCGALRWCHCRSHKFGFGERWIDQQTGEITKSPIVRIV
jgi:hypothetical protein